LEIVSASDHPKLIAKVVSNVLFSLPKAKDVGVAEIDQSFSDTAAFCERYGVGMDISANCIVMEAKRADRTWFAVCVVPGNTRADINGLVRRTLDARRVSFASMDDAVKQTGMEYGAITPIGLPSGWPILIDQAVADAEYVIIGSGVRKSKLAVPGKLFADLPGVQILENLGRPVAV
jgi:prolyl-tRNA editing enzyme YbaK/EbsC (Cys-tRNA(Pro) deacylase)